MVTAVVQSGDEITYSDVFNECLDAIECEQATIADCVAQHPEIPELEALLTTASAAHELSYVAMASKANLRQKVLAQFETQMATATPKPRVLHLPRVPRYAAAYLRVAAIICAVLFVGLGAGLSSGQAVPGDRLYFVKRAFEQAQLSLSSDQSRPDVWYRIAEIRIQELTILASRQQPLPDSTVSDMLADMTTALNMQNDPTKRTVLIQEMNSALDAAAQNGAISAQAQADALSTLNALVTPPDNHTNTVAFVPSQGTPDTAILNVPSGSPDDETTDSSSSPTYSLPLVPVSPPELSVPTAPNINDNSNTTYTLPLVPVGSH